MSQLESMDRAMMLTVLGVASLIAVTLIVFIVAAHIADIVDDDGIPGCYEDEVLVGRGYFYDGRWDDYVCRSPSEIKS